MIFSFHCTNTLYWDKIVLLSFFSNHWSTWELSNSKNWKRHYYIYLIFEDKRRSFLKFAERRKRIGNIFKREKSFRIGDHFSEIIENVSFFLFLNMIFAPFRLPAILEKLHKKSTQTQQNDFSQTKCDLKLAKKCHVNKH